MGSQTRRAIILFILPRAVLVIGYMVILQTTGQFNCHLILSDCAKISKACKEQELFILALSFLRLRLLKNIHQGRLFVRFSNMVFYGSYCVCRGEL